MTRDDIIAMAREAGLLFYYHDRASWSAPVPTYEYPDKLERFAALVAEAERAACAKVCDDAVNSISETADAEVREVATNVCINLGRAIRARGTT
jgi:hypothetical protein